MRTTVASIPLELFRKSSMRLSGSGYYADATLG